MSGLPKLGKREMDALREIAGYQRSRLRQALGVSAFFWRPKSMEKLAAHGLVERHWKSMAAYPAWQITDAGVARIEQETQVFPLDGDAP